MLLSVFGYVLHAVVAGVRRLVVPWHASALDLRATLWTGPQAAAAPPTGGGARALTLRRPRDAHP